MNYSEYTDKVKQVIKQGHHRTEKAQLISDLANQYKSKGDADAIVEHAKNEVQRIVNDPKAKPSEPRALLVVAAIGYGAILLDQVWGVALLLIMAFRVGYEQYMGYKSLLERIPSTALSAPSDEFGVTAVDCLLQLARSNIHRSIILVGICSIYTAMMVIWYLK